MREGKYEAIVSDRRMIVLDTVNCGENRRDKKTGFMIAQPINPAAPLLRCVKVIRL